MCCLKISNAKRKYDLTRDGSMLPCAGELRKVRKKQTACYENTVHYEK